MARSRRPLVVVMSGAFRSAWACFSDSQLPARTPMDLALFTRWMPAASSGASSPLSVASTASLRMADMRTMMDDDPSPRSSSVTRHALTVALVKPGRGSRRYQSKNSSKAMLYTRFVIGDETLSSTRAFILRHSVALSTTVNSFILCLLLVNIGSHSDLTSQRWGQQELSSGSLAFAGRQSRHRSSCVCSALRCPKKRHDTLSLPIIQVPLGPSLDWPLRRLVEAS